MSSTEIANMSFPTWANLLVAATFALWPVTLVRADGNSPPATPPRTPALLPGAATVLCITEITEAGMALEQSFADPIEVILKAGGPPLRQTPPHCRALIDLEDRITGTWPAGDWNVLQLRLADCHALLCLAHAAAPTRSAMPTRLQAARKTVLWPARTWPAVSLDEAKALARPGQTLQTASVRRSWQMESVSTTDTPTLRLDSLGYTLRVQWLAHGDFDGDGWEDWLLRWQAQAVGGSWRAARILLLSRKRAVSGFSAQDQCSQR